MSIRRFEELVVWQKARCLCTDVHLVSGRGRFARHYALRDQVQRAAVSIMANIAEGFERYSRPDFRRFLSIARGSAGELRSELYVAHDLGYLDENEFTALLAQCEEISRLLAALRASIH